MCAGDVEPALGIVLRERRRGGTQRAVWGKLSCLQQLAKNEARKSHFLTVIAHTVILAVTHTHTHTEGPSPQSRTEKQPHGCGHTLSHGPRKPRTLSHSPRKPSISAGKRREGGRGKEGMSRERWTSEASTAVIAGRGTGETALNSPRLCSAFPSPPSALKKSDLLRKAKDKRFPGIKLMFQAREAIGPITVYLQRSRMLCRAEVDRGTILWKTNVVDLGSWSLHVV